MTGRAKRGRTGVPADGPLCPADIVSARSWACNECGRGRGRLAGNDYLIAREAYDPLMILDLTGVLCPMGCGQTLHRMSSGMISCLNRNCPDREAAQKILADPGFAHLAYVHEDGCTMRHPLRERIGNGLSECGLLEKVMAAGPPAGGPGEYRVTDEDGELKWEKIMSGPGYGHDVPGDDTPSGAFPVIMDALRLARERVTGDDPEEKERQRERLADLIVRMHAANAAARPTGTELSEALGNPDDGRLRQAISAWDRARE